MPYVCMVYFAETTMVRKNNKQNMSEIARTSSNMAIDYNPTKHGSSQI